MPEVKGERGSKKFIVTLAYKHNSNSYVFRDEYQLMTDFCDRLCDISIRWSRVYVRYGGCTCAVVEANQ